MLPCHQNRVHSLGTFKIYCFLLPYSKTTFSFRMMLSSSLQFCSHVIDFPIHAIKHLDDHRPVTWLQGAHLISCKGANVHQKILSGWQFCAWMAAGSESPPTAPTRGSSKRPQPAPASPHFELTEAFHDRARNVTLPMDLAIRKTKRPRISQGRT